MSVQPVTASWLNSPVSQTVAAWLVRQLAQHPRKRQHDGNLSPTSCITCALHKQQHSQYSQTNMHNTGARRHIPLEGAETAKSRAVGVWRWGFWVVWAGSRLNSTHMTCVIVLVSLVWCVPSNTPILFLSFASGSAASFFTAPTRDCGQ